MSSSSQENEARSAAAEKVRRAFTALPFEQQISTLIRIELDMLGEVVETVASAASRAADDIVNACKSYGSSTSEASSAGNPTA